MNTFGTIKSKIIKKLTESYISDNKSDIKEIVNIMKNDKEFRELYLFYEDIENKYFDDSETAKLYVEQISSMLSNKKSLIENTCKKLDVLLENVDVEQNKTYDALDQLLDIDSLKNVDKKVVAKKKIVEYITESKPVQVNEVTEFTENERLLYTVMTNNFNSFYEQQLNEEEKSELKNILSLSNEDLNNKITTLKESILSKITDLVKESKVESLTEKLNTVRQQVNSSEVSRYSYYKLNNLLKDME